MRVTVMLLGLCMAAIVVVSCDSRSQPGRGGPGSVADIAVFLVEDATDDDLVEVSNLLFVPFVDSSGDVNGSELIDGLFGVDWDYVDRVLYIRILPGTGSDRVDEIVTSLMSDSRVDRVERDYQVPSHLD